MLKRSVAFAFGFALLVSPLAVSAQTVSAATSASSNASLIALLTQLIQVLEQELQMLLAQHGTPPSPPTPPNPILCPVGQHSNGSTCIADSVAAAKLSAAPSSGSAPLAVSFAGTSVTGGQQYIIEYGDGQHSDPLAALDVCMHLSDGSGGCPKVQSSHTYTTLGTYTATLEGYVACMWSNPRCMIATMPLATAAITVTGSGTAQYNPILCPMGEHSNGATCVSSY